MAVQYFYNIVRIRVLLPDNIKYTQIYCFAKYPDINNNEHYFTNSLFPNQIKMAIPTQVSAKHHLLFRFYHVSCEMGKGTVKKKDTVDSFGKYFQNHVNLFSSVLLISSPWYVLYCCIDTPGRVGARKRQYFSWTRPYINVGGSRQYYSWLASFGPWEYYSWLASFGPWNFAKFTQ